MKIITIQFWGWKERKDYTIEFYSPKEMSFSNWIARKYPTRILGITIYKQKD